MELIVDIDRLECNSKHDFVSGFTVRAKMPGSGKWVNADIADLDKESLLIWLRSNGPLVEDLIGKLLGHGYFHRSRAAPASDDRTNASTGSTSA